jgi:BASS family bile acid:Na+ symporter
MLDLIMRIGIMLFMVGSLGGVGLRVTPSDLLRPLQHTTFLIISLVTSWVVCPLVAVLVLKFVPIAQPYAAGLMLLSLAPCAPFAPAMVRIARGDGSYLAAFMVLSAITTVVFMPIGVPLLLDGVRVSPWNIARPLLLFVLLPLLAGMTISGTHPHAAAWMRPRVETLTTVAALAMFVPIVHLFGPGILNAIGTHAIAAQILFLVIVTSVTHALGAALHRDQQSVVTLGISTRNLGAALAPISAVAADERGVVMIALGAVATLLWSAVLARYLGGRVTSQADAPAVRV